MTKASRSKISDGIPTLQDYKKLLKTSNFKKIEEYSDEFISKVGGTIKSYNNRWVEDPLHQWSRQWEYPYIIYRISKTKKTNMKILDLGAGMTFLPYYLQELKNVDKIIALDYDKTLSGLYDKVNKILSKKVEFKFGDIRNLAKGKKENYDYIYSVSVLEHTDNYDEIIKSCYRLLKKGGKFSITFDISLDGNDDIPVNKAEKLLHSIHKTFKTGERKQFIRLKKGIVRSDDIARKISTDLMPWKYPSLNVVKTLYKKGKIGSRYKKLTFYCITVEKL